MTNTVSNSNQALKIVTSAQIKLAKHLVYAYKISITIPATCKEMSRKLTDISVAIRKGKVTARTSEAGYVKMEANRIFFFKKAAPAKPLENKANLAAHSANKDNVANNEPKDCKLEEKKASEHHYTCKCCKSKFVTNSKIAKISERICPLCQSKNK